MNAVRATLALGIAAAYAAVVLASEQPAAMALGLAPLAWIALEGCWRLCAPQR
jgi:hypothetical protein